MGAWRIEETKEQEKLAPALQWELELQLELKAHISYF
jgi:hypothetical protein